MTSDGNELYKRGMYSFDCYKKGIDYIFSCGDFI